GAPNAGGFTLGAVQLLAQGGQTGNIDSIHLYAISTAPSASASASYNDGAGHNLGPDLLNAGNGYSFGWNPGAGTWLTQFTFDGPDQVPLVSGTTYVLEVWAPISSANNFVWMRNGGSPADPGGQMFGAHNSNIADQTAAGGQRQTINQEGLAGGTPRIA